MHIFFNELGGSETLRPKSRDKIVYFLMIALTIEAVCNKIHLGF